MLRSALFDLDGTLIDSGLDIAEAFRRAATDRGLHPPELAAVAPLIGRTLRDMSLALWGDLPEERIEAISQSYRNHYRELLGNRTVAHRGAAELLAALRPLRLAVATTKQTWMAELALERVHLRDRLDHVQGTDGFPAKPDPEVLLRAADALAVPPGECIYVGDGVWDMEAAARAGMRAIGVAHGASTEGELLAAGALVVAPSLEELGPIIRGLYPGTI